MMSTFPTDWVVLNLEEYQRFLADAMEDEGRCLHPILYLNDNFRSTDNFRFCLTGGGPVRVRVSVLRIRIRIRIRIGSGFKSSPGSGSGSGFGIRIRIRIQQVNFSCFEAYKSPKTVQIQPNVSKGSCISF